MRITQGTFSFLPDLTDAQIEAQVQYCLDHEWAVGIEYTDDPHPRNTYWEMWGAPMFDIPDAAGVMMELEACRKAKSGGHYIRLNAFDNAHGWESLRLSFITDRPANEPGFALLRQEGEARSTHYSTQSYATGQPAGERYAG